MIMIDKKYTVGHFIQKKIVYKSMKISMIEILMDT